MNLITGEERDRLMDMAQEIDRGGLGLTDWEVDFISNLLDEDPEFLTQGRADKIEEIYEERVP